MFSNEVFDNYPDILTVDEAGKILRVGKKTIYTLMNNNNLRYIKIGRKFVTSKKWIKEYLESSI